MPAVATLNLNSLVKGQRTVTGHARLQAVATLAHVLTCHTADPARDAREGGSPPPPVAAGPSAGFAAARAAALARLAGEAASLPPASHTPHGLALLAAALARAGVQGPPGLRATLAAAVCGLDAGPCALGLAVALPHAGDLAPHAERDTTGQILVKCRLDQY
jgi:hypothetical protein